MWARRGEGQEFARLERKGKYENVPNCIRGRDGDHRFRPRIQSTNRPAKTGACNAHAAGDVATAPR
jgi:hypothetical protein